MTLDNLKMVLVLYHMLVSALLAFANKLKAVARSAGEQRMFCVKFSAPLQVNIACAKQP